MDQTEITKIVEGIYRSIKCFDIPQSNNLMEETLVDLGMDSLDIVELFIRTEVECEVALDQSQIKTLTCLRDLVEAVVEVLKREVK